jgi:hypothetical protein
MIKLQFANHTPTLNEVRSLPGMAGLDLDEAYGLICISPKEKLFIVRAKEVDDVERRKKTSPEILDVYGDIRISAFESNTQPN